MWQCISYSIVTKESDAALWEKFLPVLISPVRKFFHNTESDSFVPTVWNAHAQICWVSIRNIQWNYTSNHPLIRNDMFRRSYLAELSAETLWGPKTAKR